MANSPQTAEEYADELQKEAEEVAAAVEANSEHPLAAAVLVALALVELVLDVAHAVVLDRLDLRRRGAARLGRVVHLLGLLGHQVRALAAAAHGQTLATVKPTAAAVSSPA